MNWETFFTKEEKLPYYQKLMTFVDKEYDTKVIFPCKENLFTAFELTPFDQVKMVIIGQDPYHDFKQAHGLAFSVQDGCKIPPSLRNIFKEYESDLGLQAPLSGNLSAWAKQGVLLINSILTVEAHKPLSHKKKGWETFTNHVIESLNQDERPKVFVLWGNQARNLKQIITHPNHLIIESSHPSPLSARHSFFGSKLFSKTNAFLRENKQNAIDFNLKKVL